MHPSPRRIIPVVLLIALIAAGVWYFTRPAAAQDGALSASGTIEALTINVSPELGGRVVSVNAAEGDSVQAGDVLIQFDTTLLEAQRAQAKAAVSAAEAANAAAQAGQRAAQSAAEAAAANYDLLKAGPSAEQLQVTQTLVDKAQLAVAALQDAYDDLHKDSKETASARELKHQLDQAQATLDNAQAQYDFLAAGARSEQLAVAQAQVNAAQAQAEVAQAQVDATQGQVDAARAAIEVLNVQITKLTLKAPAAGVILARAIEPGEFATPGATLLVIGDLNRLTITVYVPEDRYGQISLGQTATVTVDSFPGQTFTATVTHIANQAEFTPRNVQTADGRKTTVFAIELAIENTDGKLKPGMPADVSFGK
ncbi:MAG: HlyD family secretion protein [Anaerolineales bacterium]